MTVTEALAFFADSKEVAVRLAPLADVGLEYVKLGQPVPTLSGGEAQRLKLAGHLAAAGARRLEHHSSRQAVPVRRADDRPALRGRGEAAARVPQAARGGAFAARHRAQPRPHSRGGLDHRPRPGRRRSRRRDRVRRHAADEVRAHERSHTGQGTRRIRARRSAASATRNAPATLDGTRDADARATRHAATARARTPSSSTTRASTTSRTSTWRFRATASR